MWPETQLFDDGTHGDAVAGDKTYTFQYLVPKGLYAPGAIQVWHSQR